jgi:hypothetical protein
MTEDREQLERELTQHLSEAAAAPRSDAAARVRARVATTPQRGAWRVQLGAAMRSPGWGRAAALATVAAAALLLGIYIGQVALPIELGPSASPSAIADASSTPVGAWVEPTAYSYVLDSSCGERMLIGRFRVTVVGGRTTAFEELNDPPTGQFRLADIPTLGDLVQEVERARTDGADTVILEVDPGDGHPVRIEIDWMAEAIDDEACYAISEYVVRGQPSETPAPSPGEPTSYALWERFEMEDPDPALYGGARPSGVVAFGDGYVAVGTMSGCCAGEPSENVGVVWASADGRNWRLVDVGDTFEHATLDQVLVAGDRLIVAGSYAEPVEGGLATPVGATWISTDGVDWQRAEGPAPSKLTATPDGLFGAAEVDGGVASYASSDGLNWTQLRLSHDMERLSAVASTAAGVLVVGNQPGTPLDDGTPTSDVVAWTSTDQASWTGHIAIENAVFTSVVSWRNGYAAVGSRYRTGADGSVIGEASVWTSPDGLSWEPLETDFGHPSETGMEVFAVGENLVIAVECCGGDLVLRSSAWVSEDGVAWTPVPTQPAFDGSEVVITAVAETPQGLVAVGHRLDPGPLHRLPQAWLASSEPMVWLEPSSEGGADVGEERAFEMGHCGLTSPIDFDGSLWAPEGDPLALPFDMTSGTIVLVEPDRARFVSEGGLEVFLRRLEGAAAYPLCD